MFIFKSSLYYINPLILTRSDQHLISPYYISSIPESHVKIRRMKEMFTN